MNPSMATVLLAVLLAAPAAWGQAAEPRGGAMPDMGGGGDTSQAPTRQGPIWRAVDRPSLGGGFMSTQTDYGLGASLTTPFRYDHRIAFRGGIERQFIDGVPEGESDEIRHSYTVFRGGVVGFAGMVADHVYLYLEGGFLVVQPDTGLANEAAFGGYGQVGMEFFPRLPEPRHQYSVYFDFGLRGAPDAVAKDLEGAPFYANGFTTRAGARYYF